METRRRSLPVPWYPQDAAGIRTALAEWELLDAGRPPVEPGACAAVAPHAGWHYSGALAWLAWRAALEADTVVVIGGHLPAGSAFLVAPEDGYRTPLGDMAADRELRDELRSRLGAGLDLESDNTVEVQLPLAKARFPDASALWIRAPNDAGSGRLGELLAELEAGSARRLFVLGSTDLTHYGPAYGWAPVGGGPAGAAWADGADRAMADALAAMDADEALGLATARRAACSVGAAIAAMAYARARGAVAGERLALASSRDLSRGDSFVGYATVIWRPGVSPRDTRRA